MLSHWRAVFTSVLGRCCRLCHHRLLLKLVILSCIVSALFTFKLHQYMFNESLIETNAVARKLGTAYSLIQDLNQKHFDDLQNSDVFSDDEKWKAVKLVRNGIKKLNLQCSSQSDDCAHNYNKKALPLLTLFTTWYFDKDKLAVNNRTLTNWRMLPDVNLIVFTNCSVVKEYSEAAGWTVLPVLRGATDIPELPYMFMEAKHRFSSSFYCFANADLLFTEDGLIRTLQKIRCEIQKMNEANILIVGQRTNIPAALLTDEIAESATKLETFSLEHGSRFSSDAEDYFITDRSFPWARMLPVAVGRRAYDNYVVAYARDSNTTVIDVSDSVACLHQTVETLGNFEGLNKGTYNSYNYDLIKRYGGPGSRFFGARGRTDCTQWRTWQDLCGRVHVGKRTVFESDCFSVSFSNHFQSFFRMSWGS